jgi:hypothetical protein
MACRFSAVEGDLVTYLNVWKAWNDSGRDRRWAHRYCLNHRNLLRAADIRTQLEYQARWTGQLIHMVLFQTRLRPVCGLSAGFHPGLLSSRSAHQRTAASAEPPLSLQVPGRAGRVGGRRHGPGAEGARHRAAAERRAADGHRRDRGARGGHPRVRAAPRRRQVP